MPLKIEGPRAGTKVPVVLPLIVTRPAVSYTGNQAGASNEQACPITATFWALATTLFATVAFCAKAAALPPPQVASTALIWIGKPRTFGCRSIAACTAFLKLGPDSESSPLPSTATASCTA